MSEQDATDEESPGTNGQTPDEAGADGDEPSDPESAGEDLDSFAAEPDGDAASALDGIIDELAEAEAEGSVSVSDEGDVDDGLVDRVSAASPEETAQVIATLRTRVQALEDALDEREAEIDDLESRVARKQADFQNYKKRQEERLEEEKARATEDLVSRLVDVRDNLKRALDQDEDTDIRGGVESTLSQFDEELDRENVTPIEPEPGDEVDPQRMETLATISSDQPEGTVAQVHRPGYEMAGKVIRTAQVVVSDGSES